jgi:hypothetical protein
MEKTGQIAYSLQSVSNATLCEGGEKTRKAQTGNTVIPNAIAHGNQKIDHLCICIHSHPAETLELLPACSADEGLLQAQAERATHDRQRATYPQPCPHTDLRSSTRTAERESPTM